MNASMISRRRRRAALALGCAFAVTGGTAHAAVGGFQGDDGDQTATCLEVRDWACLSAAEVLAAPDASGSADDVFAGGKELAPDQWTFKTGSVAAKADLQEVWTNVTG